MKQIAMLALYAYVPFVLLVFAVMRPRQAVIFAYIGGFLFLPMLTIKFSGIPDLTKITAASFGVTFGALLFDTKTVLSFRPKWYDLPMLLWCVSPFVTSVVNDLGTYDGASNIVQQVGLWGIPYYIGRVYFKDLESFRDLGMGIVIGGLAYTPFVWTEMWISPQLHKMVYGIMQHDFSQTKRWGGYRPMVFMQSGLALAMFMTTAALVAGWMWMTGSVKKLWNMPFAGLVAFLFLTAILCKTMAAIAFLFVGCATLVYIKQFRNGLPLVVLLLIPPIYMVGRSKEWVTMEMLTAPMEHVTTADRLQSLQTRMVAEDMVTAKALTPVLKPNGDMYEPMWGWGKWDPTDGRKTPWRVYREWEKRNEEGLQVTIIRDAAPTDGLWMITLGQFGIAGLFLMTASIMMPAVILWRRIPLRYWSHPAVAPVAAMAVLLLLHMADNLLNAFVNPIFLIALGGVGAIAPAVRQIAKRYGPVAAEAVLTQAGGGVPAAAAGGFPVYGNAGMPNMGYRPAGVVPATAYGPTPGMPSTQAYAPPTPQGFGMDGFPVIPGLQPGSVSWQQPRRK